MDPLAPAVEIARAVRAREVTAAEVTDAALARVAERDPSLSAFLFVAEEEARREAAAVDRRLAAGKDPGSLAGVPVAVKDNLCTRDLPTTCASRILEGHRPLYDATAVRKIREAGGVVIGKTNLDEFGMGSSTENSAFFPTRNPWDPGRVPGGSSGGSAAAVAGGMVPLALGSDTGGSLRQPGALCGLLALKPTYGRVSRFGLVAFASSLDQVGGFARDAASLALLQDALSGRDERDSTSAPRPAEPLDPSRSVNGLRLGVACALLDGEGVEPAVTAGVRETARILEDAGMAVSEVALPDPEAAIAAYYLLANAEASSNLARYDGVRYGVRVRGEDLGDMYKRTRSAGFGAEVKRRIMLGTYALSAGYYEAFYGRAAAARRSLRRAFAERFRSLDLILLPTSPTAAFRLGERVDDPLAMYLADVFTGYANLTGIPGINLPAGRSGDGLPVGAQLLAAPWREDLLLAAAGAVERSRPPEPAPAAGDGR